jgi:tetratricopeptide (TPR) repeat protein
MKKPGRNDPCPCGSGKKYKKCCLHTSTVTGDYVYTDLDQLSNEVPALIEQGKLDEAEAVCQRLTEQYPEQIDGIHRYAEVYEAKGDKLKAAQYYRKTAEFAKQADGFDEESVKFFLKQADRLAGDVEV